MKQLTKHSASDVEIADAIRSERNSRRIARGLHDVEREVAGLEQRLPLHDVRVVVVHTRLGRQVERAHLSERVHAQPNCRRCSRMRISTRRAETHTRSGAKLQQRQVDTSDVIDQRDADALELHRHALLAEVGQRRRQA